MVLSMDLGKDRHDNLEQSQDHLKAQTALVSEVLSKSKDPSSAMLQTLCIAAVADAIVRKKAHFSEQNVGP